MVLFGVRGKNARTLNPGRTQENIISTYKNHSQNQIEALSVGKDKLIKKDELVEQLTLFGAEK